MVTHTLPQQKLHFGCGNERQAGGTVESAAKKILKLIEIRVAKIQGRNILLLNQGRLLTLKIFLSPFHRPVKTRIESWDRG